MSLEKSQNSPRFESQEMEEKNGKRNSLSDGLLYVDRSNLENVNELGGKGAILNIKSNRKFDNLPFIALLVIFVVTSSLIAINLREGIAPDEVAHFNFANHFSFSFGLPHDNATTISLGMEIRYNPVLYHWLAGRIISVVRIVAPNTTEIGYIISVRLFSVLSSAFSLIFLYKTSKKLVQNYWLQLLPVFLLVNTIMFTFLSSAVSYDNLANMFSFAAIYHFTCFFLDEKPTKNSILMLIYLGLASLVKTSALPLVLGVGSWWLFLVFRRSKKTGFVFRIKAEHTAILIICVMVLSYTIALYGNNIIKFHSITPSCSVLYDQQLCDTSPTAQRKIMSALPKKLTISESIQQGYLDPVEYAFYSWIPNILYRTYGILAHLSYFPAHIVVLYYILYILYFALGFRVLPKQPNMIFLVFATLIVLYVVSVFIWNYNSELIYGFRQIGVQGRYLFNVIGVFYMLIAKILEKGKNYRFVWFLGFITLALFTYAGPLSFLIHYSAVFKDWFR